MFSWQLMTFVSQMYKSRQTSTLFVFIFKKYLSILSKQKTDVVHNFFFFLQIFFFGIALKKINYSRWQLPCHISAFIIIIITILLLLHFFSYFSKISEIVVFSFTL